MKNTLISSDDSGSNDDTNVVRPIPWRSKYVNTMFERIDRYNAAKKFSQACRQMKSRVTGVPSSRTIPTSRMGCDSRCRLIWIILSAANNGTGTAVWIEISSCSFLECMCIIITVIVNLSITSIKLNNKYYATTITILLWDSHLNCTWMCMPWH